MNEYGSTKDLFDILGFCLEKWHLDKKQKSLLRRIFCVAFIGSNKVKSLFIYFFVFIFIFFHLLLLFSVKGLLTTSLKWACHHYTNFNPDKRHVFIFFMFALPTLHTLTDDSLNMIHRHSFSDHFSQVWYEMQPFFSGAN